MAVIATVFGGIAGFLSFLIALTIFDVGISGAFGIYSGTALVTVSGCLASRLSTNGRVDCAYLSGRASESARLENSA